VTAVDDDDDIIGKKKSFDKETNEGINTISPFRSLSPPPLSSSDNRAEAL
jgi:hypothetical protein